MLVCPPALPPTSKALLTEGIRTHASPSGFGRSARSARSSEMGVRTSVPAARVSAFASDDSGSPCDACNDDCRHAITAGDGSSNPRTVHSTTDGARVTAIAEAPQGAPARETLTEVPPTGAAPAPTCRKAPSMCATAPPIIASPRIPPPPLTASAPEAAFSSVAPPSPPTPAPPTRAAVLPTSARPSFPPPAALPPLPAASPRSTPAPLHPAVAPAHRQRRLQPRRRLRQHARRLQQQPRRLH
jgi:hypothetical protein